jgi:RNA 3'-terminal phosphate cyclase
MAGSPPNASEPGAGAQDDDDRVTITVQWRGSRPGGDSRATRKVRLSDRLHEILDEHPDLDVDWGSVSLSAQTVEATVARERLARAADALQDQGLRVDEVVDRQIVE